ncbi:hypothetical protein L3081_18690 [Colwellia sp. MSW7]|uniref:Uncharacterized protein n=1 Tax=Colwellia maritima TaxID=2912588 RepID=A0ABS9X494_9GAMM|nr:hypothetical protein [Colwellia maritima]MCI2285049.1 hypothetical protein [Colwellia maritima]
MNNKIIKGLTQSALALSLAFLSFTSSAGVTSPPTDITLGLPITIEAGNDLVEVGGPGNFGVLAPPARRKLMTVLQLLMCLQLWTQALIFTVLPIMQQRNFM